MDLGVIEYLLLLFCYCWLRYNLKYHIYLES